MGFFDPVPLCIICDKPTSSLSRTKILNDKYICLNCEHDLRYTNIKKKISEMTAEEIKSIMNAHTSFLKIVQSFDVTKRIGDFIEFDDNQKIFIVLIYTKFNGIKKLRNARIYNYDDILSFDLLQDGETIRKGGIGSALVGAALFGGVGAIVGGITGRKTKEVCNNLSIKITLNNLKHPVETITFLENTRKDNMAYSIACQQAQECLSILQVISNTQQPVQKNNDVSVADEILKFKKLMVAGIITKEEYETRKNQLLGLV